MSGISSTAAITSASESKIAAAAAAHNRTAATLKDLRYMLTHDMNEILGSPTTAPLTGLTYIGAQLREILIMFSCGACIAFLFQIYDVALHKLKPSLPDRLAASTLTVRIADIFFCICAGFIMMQFWYGSSYCNPSVHESLSLVGGILLGRKVFNLRKSKHMHTIASIYVILLVIAYIIIA